MAISITIRYTKEDQQEGLHSYGLLVEALSATDMPDKIFVIQRGVPSAVDTEVDEIAEMDKFQFIASPLELRQYPADAPNLAKSMPYYRVNAIRLTFRSPLELAETLDMIKADIAKLVDSLKSELALTDAEEVTYD